jgi:hypothetical protein
MAKVTPANEASIERLALLLEEMGEAQQIIGKILRHGPYSTDPTAPIDDRPSNISLLERELGDVTAAIRLLVRGGDVGPAAIRAHATDKLDRVQQYLHHAENQAAALALCEEDEKYGNGEE